MPIDLTTPTEDSGPRRSRRRHRTKKHTARWQAVLGVVVALAMLGGLATWLILQQPAAQKLPAQVVVFKPADGYGPPSEPGSPETIAAPPAAPSAEGASSAELPEDRAKAKVLAVRRVSGVDNADNLQIEYEFLKSAKTPNNYLIVLSTPAGKGPASFAQNAARRDVVQISMSLNSLGSRGPIHVWIETQLGERVSNIMTLP